MKKVTVIAAILIVVGLAVSSCNTYKRCPAYGGHSAVEVAPVADKA